MALERQKSDRALWSLNRNIFRLLNTLCSVQGWEFLPVETGEVEEELLGEKARRRAHNVSSTYFVGWSIKKMALSKPGARRESQQRLTCLALVTVLQAKWPLVFCHVLWCLCYAHFVAKLSSSHSSSISPLSSPFHCKHLRRKLLAQQ